MAELRRDTLNIADGLAKCELVGVHLLICSVFSVNYTITLDCALKCVRRVLQHQSVVSFTTAATGITPPYIYSVQQCTASHSSAVQLYSPSAFWRLNLTLGVK